MESKVNWIAEIVLDYSLAWWSKSNSYCVFIHESQHNQAFRTFSIQSSSNGERKIHIQTLSLDMFFFSSLQLLYVSTLWTSNTFLYPTHYLQNIGWCCFFFLKWTLIYKEYVYIRANHSVYLGKFQSMFDWCHLVMWLIDFPNKNWDPIKFKTVAVITL